MSDVIRVGDTVIATQDCNGTITGHRYQVQRRGGGSGMKILNCTCTNTWVKERKDMKKIWEIIVVDKNTDEIIIREVVIDGDEKSACSKLSIKFATKLKDIVFDNLCYVTKELGSYESKKK